MAAIIAIHRQLRVRWPHLLLLWAPRHPERFKAVTQASVDAGWRVSTRKLTRWPDRDDAVFVIDTLGEEAVQHGARVAVQAGERKLVAIMQQTLMTMHGKRDAS